MTGTTDEAVNSAARSWAAHEKGVHSRSTELLKTRTEKKRCNLARGWHEKLGPGVILRERNTRERTEAKNKRTPLSRDFFRATAAAPSSTGVLRSFRWE
jgi:hypothetical protein